MHDSSPANVRPGPSVIAGQGLFASAPIDTGTPVPEAIATANHSCDPNLWWSGDELVALREIAAGEELTYDYATDGPAGVLGPGALLRCNCGSMRCRGLIEADDRQIPELQRRYAGHFRHDVP
ncbi:MAG TPA: SET domain-containing protein [Jatrophihabitantaceae bacterium]|nr:SET domain-containing protein [Jatrophihabitantaceae bacterium]